MELSVSLNPTRLTNTSNINLQRAHLVIVSDDGATQYAKFSLADLQTAYSAGTPLSANYVVGSPSFGGSDTAHFKLRMQLDSDATSAQQQIELENLDFVFSGKSA